MHERKTWCSYGPVQGRQVMCRGVNGVFNDIQKGPLTVYDNDQGVLNTHLGWSSDSYHFYGHLDVGDLNGDGWPDLFVNTRSSLATEEQAPGNGPYGKRRGGYRHRHR